MIEVTNERSWTELFEVLDLSIVDVAYSAEGTIMEAEATTIDVDMIAVTPLLNFKFPHWSPPPKKQPPSILMAFSIGIQRNTVGESYQKYSRQNTADHAGLNNTDFTTQQSCTTNLQSG
jgi:hypothetical protein